MLRTGWCGAVLLFAAALAGCADNPAAPAVDGGMDATASDGGSDADTADSGTDTGTPMDASADAAVDMATLGDGSVPSRASFFVTSTLAYDTSEGGGAPSALTHDFALYVDGIGSATINVIAASHGDTQRFTLAAGTEPNTYVISDEINMDFEAPQPTSCGRNGPIHYSALSITFSDSDLDGVAEITGTAEGRVDTFGGDVIWSTPFIATLSGDQEENGPVVAGTIRSSEVVHPADRFAFFFNEALEPTVTGVFHSASLDMPLVWESDAEAPIYASATGLFPWGASFTTMLSDAKDFTGNVVTSELPSFTTVADPGLFAEWTFEATPIHAYLENEARRADLSEFGYGVTQHALYVASSYYDSEMGARVPAGRATLRLPLGEGLELLNFSIALVMNEGVEATNFLGDIDVIVASTGERLDVDIPDFDPGDIENNHTPFATVSVMVDSASFSGASELIFDVRGDGVGCGFRPPPPRGILIDDITFSTLED